MAYRKKELYEKALKIAKSKKCYFIEDVIGFLPCTKPTFYAKFKVESNEFNAIKSILEENRVSDKLVIKRKLLKSNQPQAMIAAYKILCTDEERRALSMQHIESNEKVTIKLFQRDADD